jgi:hypothetical protein
MRQVRVLLGVLLPTYLEYVLQALWRDADARVLNLDCKRGEGRVSITCDRRRHVRRRWLRLFIPDTISGSLSPSERADTVTRPPEGVNLTALERRLIKICLNRSGSPTCTRRTKRA